MVQKLSFWLCAILAALVANTYAFRINNERTHALKNELKNQLPANWQSGRCISECLKENTLFTEKNVHFELGKTYQYRVRSSNEARTLFAMASEEQQIAEQKHAKEHLFGVDATVLVTPVSNCELSMQLKNVRLQFQEEREHEQETERRVQQLKEQLEKAILFGYQHGIVSDVCVDAQEQSSLAVNIKKSIISALQTTPRMTETENFKVYESDLHGKCETEYSIEKKSSNKFVVEKQKSMDKCENTEEPREFVSWKNIVLRKHQETESRCRQVVEHREVKQAKCQSARIFRTGFANMAIELASEIEIELQKVYAVDEERSQVPEQWRRHSPRLMMSLPKYYEEMNFNNVESRRVEIEDGRTELKQILAELCQDIKRHDGRVGIKTPQHVQKLHVVLRDARREDVEFVWKNIVEPKTVCQEHAKKVRDIFVDTAASVMNENVVDIVRDEIYKNLERKESKTAEKRVRYLATLISFAAEPTPRAVRELVVPELLEKIEDAQILLSFSALVKKAQEHFVEPTYVEAVYETIVRKVVRLTQEQPKKFEIEAIRMMRALENIAPRTRVTGQLELVKIITDKRMPVAIRASAIKSLQFVELEPQVRHALYRLFTEQSESNEIRTVAYLTLVHNHVTVEELKQILVVVREEQRRNVDLFNFVASHQKNLRTTEDIKKRQLLPLNAPLFPEPQAITNFWVSRSYEYTYVDEKTMIGAIVEADVVMEQDSRVPRYVTFNLTVPVAEQEIPIVALTIRQEGMDKIFAQKLDTLKQFVKKAPATIVKELIKMAREEHDRSLRNQANFEGKWQIFLNVDGKNVFVWDSTENKREQQQEMETIFAQLYRRMPIRIDETMVVMPLKHTVRLPTVSGVPVNFEFNTTIVASLETELKGHQTAGHFWEMHFRPTFAVEVGVGLEADVRSVGFEKVKRVQFVNRLYAAPAVHLKTELKPETREMRVKLMMPEQEQTLIRFETEYNNEKDSEIVFEQIPENSLVKRMIKARVQQKRSAINWFRDSSKAHEECLPALDKMLGFTVCHQKYAVEDLKAALNTRSAKKIIYQSIVKVVKTDKDMEGWEFAVELPELYRASKVQDELKFKVHFDTPKSAIPRRFTTELMVHLPQTEQDKFEVEIAVEAPIKKWKAAVLVLNKPQHKTFKFEIFAGRQERQFLLEAQTLLVQKSAKHTEAKVVFRFQPRPQIKPVEVEGKFVLNVEHQEKKKFQVLLQTEQTQIVDLTFVKTGALLQPINAKISMVGNVDILGFKVRSNFALTKDQQAGVIKTNGQVKYNKNIRNVRATVEHFETVNFSAQYTGFGRRTESGEIKKFVHLTVESTQFPRINHELTYTIQGAFPAEITQELKLVFGRPEEQQRIRFVHQGRYLSNVRSRDVNRHQTDLELEITPLNFHHELSVVVDKKPEAVAFDLKAMNKKTQELSLVSKFAYDIVQRQPLLMKASGEVKFGKYVFLYKDTVKEVAKNTFEGELFVELPHKSNSEVVPKKFNMKYTIAMHEQPRQRFEQVDRELSPIRHMIVRFVNKFQKFEHDLKIECADHGLIRHAGLVEFEHQDKLVLKAELEHNAKPIYRFAGHVIPQEKIVKYEFQAPRLSQLKVEYEFQAKDQMAQCQIKIENEKYQIESRAVADKREKHFEVFTVVKKHDKVVYQYLIKKAHKALKVEIDSPVFKTEIVTENLVDNIRHFAKRQQTPEGLVKIVIELPKKEFQTQTQIRLISAQRGVVAVHETLKNQRAVVKAELKVLPKEKVLNVEFGKKAIYRAELVKPESQVYELKSELRMEKAQVNHKAALVWKWVPAYNKDFVESFELIKFEMLNHLNEKVVFDAKYVKATEEQYRHLFVISTRKTHVELRLPAFEQSQKNVQALLVVKTKRFGGIEHQTELKQFNKDKRQLVIVSTTERNGEQLLEVVADIVLRLHEESHLKVKILNGKHAVKVDLLPLRWFNVEANFGKHWTHELKFDRKEQSKRWSVVANTMNKKEQEKYFVRFEHQCDEFSNMLIELPMLRGNVELRLDTHQAHFELRGDKQLKKWRHEGRIQWNKQEKELLVKSSTLKNEQEYIVLDAELSLRRPSTLKIVAAPLESRLIAKFDKREGAKVEIVYKQWKHVAEAKKVDQARREYQLRVETTKNEKVIVLLQATVEPTRKVELKVESNIHRLPVDFVAKYDKEERELFAEWTNKQTQRVVKVDVQLKELENIRVEFSWDAKRDTTKKIAVQIKIQKPETDRKRFVAAVRGAIVYLPFELTVDMPRNVDNWFRERHSIVGELKNMKADEKYTVQYTRKYENDRFDAELLVKKNEFVFVKSAFKVDLAEEYRTVVDIVLRSDLPIDVLNFELNWNRQTSHGQSNTKAVAKYGRHMNKSIRYEAENVAEAVRGSFVVEKDQEHKTLKFEFLKPSSKLQINVLNQTGRLLDINVDLAHSLQKKFQITSFIKSIPTVNIETAHGENSRVVIEIINEEEKKVELAFNWFGQWRRNFKLEVIFKFFAQPQIEMSIVSRHPAGVDEVDAILKVGENQYSAQYNRKFDAINKNWITKSIVQVNGEKKFEAQIECQVVDKQDDRQMITYKFVLEGVRSATGHLDIYVRKLAAERRIFPVESVEFELFNRHSKKLVGLELYVQQRRSDMEKTGMKLTAYGQTVFGLVHMINTERRADKRVSMLTLELPEDIEYVLRNEIQYEKSAVAVIRSELKKKHVAKPIYQTRIVFEHDQDADMKVMKIELINAEETEKPKLFVVRYNFAPKHCKVEEVEQRIQGLNKCYQFEILAGDRQRMIEQNQYALRIATQFFKYPIDSRHFNRTFQFALETVPEFETVFRGQQEVVAPLNFTMVGHVSTKAVGMKWFNINRHGQHKSGLVYADVKPFQANEHMINVYYIINGQKPTGFDMHFSPEHFFSTFTFNAKWNKDMIRRWIVGELPELNEMLHKPSKVGQLKRRLVREIREEFEHKIAHLKKNYNNELVKPIADEWIQVQNQLVQSEAEVAKIVAKIYRIVVERVKVVAVRLMEETHATYDDVITQIVGTLDQIKRDIVELLKKNCQKTDVCRRVVEQIEEFELEKLFKGNFGKKLEKVMKKIQKALPEDMEDTIRQIAQEIRAMHPESQEEEEEYKQINNKWNADYEDVEAVRRYYRHGARLLKMVKPEWYETLVKHAKKIARDVEQNKPIDMGEMRGKMHDLVVDMFDTLEQKTEKPVREQYYNQYNKSNKVQNDDEPNTIFSPKRGEFSFLNNQKPVWTRA